MKFPTIPHNFPWKTFGEVFNRLLNVYLLENDGALRRLCWWGNRLWKSEGFVCIGKIDCQAINLFFSWRQRKKAEGDRNLSAFESLTQIKNYI